MLQLPSTFPLGNVPQDSYFQTPSVFWSCSSFFSQIYQDQVGTRVTEGKISIPSSSAPFPPAPFLPNNPFIPYLWPLEPVIHFWISPQHRWFLMPLNHSGTLSLALPHKRWPFELLVSRGWHKGYWAFPFCSFTLCPSKKAVLSTGSTGNNLRIPGSSEMLQRHLQFLSPGDQPWQHGDVET